jgi:hypothetical protein
VHYSGTLGFYAILDLHYIKKKKNKHAYNNVSETRAGIFLAEMKVQYDGDGGRILLGDNGLPGGHATANQVSGCWNFFFKGASLHVSMQPSHSCLSSDLYRTFRHGTAAYGGECVCACVRARAQDECTLQGGLPLAYIADGLTFRGQQNSTTTCNPITFFQGTFCTTTWGNKRKCDEEPTATILRLLT